MSTLVLSATLCSKYHHFRHADVSTTLCGRVRVSVVDERETRSRPLCPECSQNMKRLVEGKNVRNYVRAFSLEEKRLMEEMARRRECSKAELIRTYVTWGLEIDLLESRR